jgi:hypothetical protein
MNEDIGTMVERNALAAYDSLLVTGEISHLNPQRHIFLIAYLKGYLKAQDDFIAQMKKGRT